MSIEQPNPRYSRLLLRLLLIALAIAVLASLAACDRSENAGGEQPTDSTSEESAPGNPTPFPQVATPLPSTPEPLVIGSSSDGGTFPVTMDSPLTLTVAGQDRIVESQNIGADGLWSPQLASDDSSAWVTGSIVNYVFGLPDTETNRALLEALVPGDQILVATRQGVNHVFTFDSRNQVPASDRTVFSQQTPGVTLLLLGGDSADRMVVRGRYEVASAAANTPSNVVQLGETAQLGDLQIRPEATSYLANRPEAPAGFGFFLVDFLASNVGLTAIDTNTYRFTLTDELGNQYPLNPIASRLGNHPPLGGFINAGQSMNASSGFQIPTGLVSPTLTWTVTDPSGAQVQAILPFTAGGDAAQNTIVSITGAQVTPDLNNLIISGQITSTGSQPLVVDRADLTLRTPVGSDYLLLATNPPFPWTVPPNQTLQFFVTYQRPIGSDSAIFTVLGQPFELSGLQPVPATSAPSGSEPPGSEPPTATPGA